MPLLRGEADDPDALSYYRVHSSDEEREAADATIDELAADTLRRATDLAESRQMQLEELLDGVAERLQDKAVTLLWEQPVWRPNDK